MFGSVRNVQFIEAHTKDKTINCFSKIGEELSQTQQRLVINVVIIIWDIIILHIICTMPLNGSS